MITVSVIMANYNTDLDFLGECVNSLLNQTVKDIEVIIIDDCSDNGSYEYLKSVKDERIKLYRNKENIGLTKNLNVALSMACGKFIARMDTDDVCEPDRFEKQIEYLENNSSIDTCCTWFRVFGNTTSNRKKSIKSNEHLRCCLLFGNTYIAHPSVMFRSEFIKRNNIRYDEELKKAQDYDMWVKCTTFGNVGTVPKVLLNYRVHSNQISVAGVTSQNQFADVTRSKLLSKLGFSKQNQRMDLHVDCYNGHNLSPEHIEWLELLKRKNDDIGIYDKKMFDSVIRSVKLKFALRTLSNSKKSFFKILSLLSLKEKFLFMSSIVAFIYKRAKKEEDLWI